MSLFGPSGPLSISEAGVLHRTARSTASLQLDAAKYICFQNFIPRKPLTTKAKGRRDCEQKNLPLQSSASSSYTGQRRKPAGVMSGRSLGEKENRPQEGSFQQQQQRRRLGGFQKEQGRMHLQLHIQRAGASPSSHNTWAVRSCRLCAIRLRDDSLSTLETRQSSSFLLHSALSLKQRATASLDVPPCIVPTSPPKIRHLFVSPLHFSS